MKKLILICIAVLIVSVPLFATTGKTTIQYDNVERLSEIFELQDPRLPGETPAKHVDRILKKLAENYMEYWDKEFDKIQNEQSIQKKQRKKFVK